MIGCVGRNLTGEEDTNKEGRKKNKKRKEPGLLCRMFSLSRFACIDTF